MPTRYQLVETCDAAQGSIASLAQPGAAIVGVSEDLWYLNGVVVGTYVPASTLSQLPGLSGIEGAIIHPRKLRQLAPVMTDAQGRDISGFYVVSDIGAALLFKYTRSAYKWAKRLIREITPSISAIESGNNTVSGCGHARCTCRCMLL